MKIIGCIGNKEWTLCFEWTGLFQIDFFDAIASLECGYESKWVLSEYDLDK